ncbi:MAG TPA: hypothetical protein PKA41_01140 [Verrucomicrobiota bacterium]|nr:hypothetical protein [Verrucomicrobiota bacterium]
MNSSLPGDAARVKRKLRTTFAVVGYFAAWQSFSRRKAFLPLLVLCPVQLLLSIQPGQSFGNRPWRGQMLLCFRGECAAVHPQCLCPVWNEFNLDQELFGHGAADFNQPFDPEDALRWNAYSKPKKFRPRVSNTGRRSGRQSFKRGSIQKPLAVHFLSKA